MGSREVFVEGSADITVLGEELYGDVQITGGAITGSLSVCADISENLEWQYDEEDITDMLDDESDDLEFLWEWLEIKGVKVWAEFLTYLIDKEELDMEDTLILRDVLLKHQQYLILKEKEEKDAAKV